MPPLYKEVYDKYKGYTLPPAVALEREMAKLGVSSKQTDKARQAFDRSALQAGFYWSGTDRLVEPALKGEAPPSRPLDAGTPGAAPERDQRDGVGVAVAAAGAAAMTTRSLRPSLRSSPPRESLGLLPSE